MVVLETNEEATGDWEWILVAFFVGQSHIRTYSQISMQKGGISLGRRTCEVV